MVAAAVATVASLTRFLFSHPICLADVPAARVFFNREIHDAGLWPPAATRSARAAPQERETGSRESRSSGSSNKRAPRGSAPIRNYIGEGSRAPALAFIRTFCASRRGERVRALSKIARGKWTRIDPATAVGTRRRRENLAFTGIRLDSTPMGLRIG